MSIAYFFAIGSPIRLGRATQGLAASQRWQNALLTKASCWLDHSNALDQNRSNIAISAVFHDHQGIVTLV
jgi:hypothetical protein